MSTAVAVAMAVGSMSVAVAGPCTMGGMMGHGTGHFMPKCTAKTGPVVWFMAAAKTYYLKGSAHYGKGMGMYVCRATAVARGGHPGPGGSMRGPHATPGSMPMPPARTMVPRPMSSPPAAPMTSPVPLPRTTTGPGLPNSTNAAPGSQGSPAPGSSGNPMSGNQGNTGAPGAGGQVPNNPASTSNSSPNPSASPRPSPRP
ncbi:MAG TPA: hypothetical protein VGC72_10685 [Candidatus Elarobacter sp.]